MFKKSALGGFKCVESTSQYSKHYKENNKENSYERYFLETDVQHLETLHKRHSDLPFLAERIKTKKVKNCSQLAC